VLEVFQTAFFLCQQVATEGFFLKSFVNVKLISHGIKVSVALGVPGGGKKDAGLAKNGTERLQ
jgi:hypothetical protein